MGKSQKPLKILVLDPCVEWDEFTVMQEQGHTIHISKSVPTATPWCDYDVILGGNAWLMDEAHRKYLDLAIKSARARRYPKEKEA